MTMAAPGAPLRSTVQATGEHAMSARARPRTKFFLYMTWAFLAIAVAGFSTTFFIPMARGAFRAPPVIHVHAAIVFGWLLMLILQATLVQRRDLARHRQFGAAGALLAAGVAVTGVLVGIHATRRDIASGGDDFVVGQFVNILIEMLLFGALVAAAIAMRRDSEAHKRLLLLAAISMLGPAWLRFRHFLPWVPNPFVTFSFVADAVLLVAIARDRIVLKRVHPAYLWGGGAMVAVHAIELAAIRSEPWLRLSRWLLDLPAP
jgi:FtsH-binding integral membrane protein